MCKPNFGDMTLPELHGHTFQIGSSLAGTKQILCERLEVSAPWETSTTVFKVGDDKKLAGIHFLRRLEGLDEMFAFSIIFPEGDAEVYGKKVLLSICHICQAHKCRVQFGDESATNSVAIQLESRSMHSFRSPRR